MRHSKSLVAIAGCATFVLAAGGFWVLGRAANSGETPDSVTGHHTDALPSPAIGAQFAGRLHPNAGGDSQVAKVNQTRRAETRGMVDGEPAAPEDDVWDTLSATERKLALRRDFEAAVEKLRGRPQSSEDRCAAETALSALRPELYSSEDGVNEHKALEAKLDGLLGEQK